MLRDRPEPREKICLSERERRTLLAIAEAVIPAGRLVPAGGPRDVDKVDRLLAAAFPGMRSAFKAGIAALDAYAYARHFRSLASLSVEKRVQLLDRWRTGSYPQRMLVRTLLAPLKIAHFDDADFYSKMGCVYPGNEKRIVEKQRWHERINRAADLKTDEEIECDVVVVGTGAGGAAVAKELAEKGVAVVLVEDGEYHMRDSFTGGTAEMSRKLMRDMGLTLALGNTAIPIPVGRAVGGSTIINSGTCYRAPDRVLAKWREQMGLVEFTPDYMAAYYERVERVLGVARAKKEYLGPAADIIARGCERLGIKHHLPLLRNAPDCDGKGLCVLGCPTDAKRSTNVSYVPLALRAGSEIWTGAKVESILLERGRAAGVIARAHGPRGAKLTIRARATIVACGTFYSPGLLERSGVGGPQLGRNLSIHPALAAAAWFDEPLKSYNFIPQGYAIEEFHDEGILFEGGQTPLDFGAGMMPQVGPAFTELVERFDHVAMFGFMIEDTSRGRVISTKGRPIVTYYLNDRDLAKLKRGQEILTRVFLAAGASKVTPMVNGFDEIRNQDDLERYRRAKLSARDFDITAYHPLGTARMGTDPRTSVVNRDHMVHDCQDLYVVDGASVPSSLAVNPQVTIMALATRAADRLADKLG
jgi:choline dehydrogenase-like flavoprotein